MRATSQGATSAVFRDSSGRLLTGFAAKITTASPLIAESEAIRTALIAAKNLELQQIIIESDNLLLIQAIKSKSTIGEVDSILQDIHHLAAEIPHCEFTWTPREGNLVADLVAGLAVANILRPNWSSDPPRQVMEALRSELLWR
ncbi:hypothetical protein PIB30_041608 [Stylosanthes scabra]|uniref:RNase H type-1 domain-containing protein n=1 Tax=Stylosanthes scabra TaxID=79078 RepID=A0ABU6WH29_9FABA|nr:hypothetical protein [Stylosanthes scabra]